MGGGGQGDEEHDGRGDGEGEAGEHAKSVNADAPLVVRVGPLIF
jgi:hypothetical protein